MSSAVGQRTFRIWRGDQTGGGFTDYETAAGEGMVVLDAVREIQRTPGAATSPSAGTARPRSAAPAAPR